MRLGLIHRPHPGLPRLAARMDLDAIRVPAECGWLDGVADGDALGNDQYSNCVPCGAVRRIQIARRVAAGDKTVPMASDALRLYRKWGWDGTPAGDVGLQSDVAAKLWSAQGVPWGYSWTDIPWIASLDPTNLAHLWSAVFALGPVQLDLRLPAAWKTQSGTTWDVAGGPAGEPGTWGDHRVCIGGFAPGVGRVLSWGREYQITAAAVTKYALGAEATVSRSWLDVTGRSPGGFDLADLRRESALLEQAEK